MFVEQMLDSARERLVVIDGGATVQQAADLMSKPHVALIIVCGPDGHMVGVVTKTDLVAQMGRCGGPCTNRVDTIMTHEVFSCRADDLLHDVWSVIQSRGLLRIPVLDPAGMPIGILHARDALPTLLTEAEDGEKMLRDYVMNVGYQ
jgi:CBS domain-containing protein